ncbi:MAG: chemotaxis protein CheC [Candidatus Omnitrophica bacterium]|nr:chemotaxis protein CheC [Candidatus Omnitrophota bacterium]MCB9748127.1 chemotaxis protein CheC [Candidatus Omnitrophota bacterium]
MEDKSRISKAIQLIAQLSIDRASQVFSKMVKCGAKISLEKVYLTDITKATEEIAIEGGEVIGAYIDLVGDAPFKFLITFETNDSLLLTDLILQRPTGSTKELDALTQSAVQEVGNILASAISNVFSSDFQIKMKPSPPQVVHDFAATLFEEYISAIAAESNEILIIESQFMVVRHNLKCAMYILPLKGSDKTLSYICNTI